MINEYQQYAAKLLFNLWRDLDADFKSAYRMKIWGMFTDNVKTAAMQSSTLADFVSKLSQMMSIDTGRNAALRSERVQLVNDLDSYQTLSVLRNNASFIVTLVRKMNDELKQDYQDSEGGDEQ